MGFQNVFGHKQKIGFAALSGPPAPVYGPYTLAFAAVVVSRGGVVTTAEKAYLTTFENSVGTDITEFDRLWIHGLSNNIAARTSFVNPSSTIATAINAPTFTPYKGYQGNGSTQYLDTNFNPATQGVKYTLNNASLGVYSLTNLSATQLEIGAVSVGDQAILDIRDGNRFYSGLNEPATNINSNNLNSTGLYIGNRLSSTSVNQYKNGLLTQSGANPSNQIPNLNIYLLCINVNLVPNLFSTRRIALSFLGSSSFNKVNFNNAVQNLATSLNWITLQQTVSAYGGVSTNTTLPTNTTGAKLVVITVQSYKLAGIPSITDNLGNTYTNVAYISGTSAPSISTFYCINPVTSTAQTFTANSPGGYPAISVNIFTGANFTFDGFNSNTGLSTTSINTGLITPSSARNLLITGINYWIGDAPNGISDSFIITNNTPATPTTLAGSTAYKFDSPAVDPLWNWTGLSGETAVMITSFTY